MVLCPNRRHNSPATSFSKCDQGQLKKIGSNICANNNQPLLVPHKGMKIYIL